jgi:uncharacterized membrane protein (UPF0127 family)
VIFDDRRARWVLIAALVLVGAGLYAFVVRGASQPADPVLERVAPSTTAALPPPGDPGRLPLPGFGELAITVKPPGIGGDLLTWCLLAAITEQQRERGLMQVTDLRGYAGMAFVYDHDVQNRFYMKNTPMPLSIAWIDAAGGVVSTADKAPCGNRDGCRLYAPGGAYRLAIEVAQGQLEALGIVPGAEVKVSGGCAPRAGASTGGVSPS